MKPFLCICACFTAAFLPVFAAAADPIEDFYRGKTVTIVVGLTAGGGYDIYARLLARHLGKHIPGKPSIVVGNMPGAGSNVAATYVARVAAKDGTYIAAPTATQPLDPILKDAADLHYDPSRVNYLGSAASDENFCIRAFMETWHDPDLLKEAANMKVDVGPTSGEEVQSLLQKIYASPPALIHSVKQAIKPK